jgi:hypothetical protein
MQGSRKKHKNKSKNKKFTKTCIEMMSQKHWTYVAASAMRRWTPFLFENGEVKRPIVLTPKAAPETPTVLDRHVCCCFWFVPENNFRRATFNSPCVFSDNLNIWWKFESNNHASKNYRQKSINDYASILRFFYR